MIDTTITVFVCLPHTGGGREVIGWIRPRCSGPNAACRCAAREGRLVHAIPIHAKGAPSWSSYHFHTIDDAHAALLAEAHS